MLWSAFPWRRFELESAWSPVDAERELPRAVPLSDEAAPSWDGPVDDRRFRFRRRTPRAAVLASVRIRPTARGSRVTVTLRWATRALLPIFIGGPLFVMFGIFSVVVAVLNGEPRVLFPWFISLALWPWPYRPYLIEARALEADLRAWFPPPAPPPLGPFR